MSSFGNESREKTSVELVTSVLNSSAITMVFYKGKTLVQTKKKLAGKNKGELDGFYLDTISEQEYFIKAPKDKRELFTELFAGKVLTLLKEKGLIPAKYHALIIFQLIFLLLQITICYLHFSIAHN